MAPADFKQVLAEAGQVLTDNAANVTLPELDLLDQIIALFQPGSAKRLEAMSATDKANAVTLLTAISKNERNMLTPRPDGTTLNGVCVGMIKRLQSRPLEIDGLALIF